MLCYPMHQSIVTVKSGSLFLTSKESIGYTPQVDSQVQTKERTCQITGAIQSSIPFAVAAIDGVSESIPL